MNFKVAYIGGNVYLTPNVCPTILIPADENGIGTEI